MAAQKAKHKEMARSMLEMLESHAASNFHFMWSGDESWMFYEYHYETMWAASCEEVNELERPTHDHRKTSVTAFLNGTRYYFLNILPRGRSINTNYFAGEIICGLEDLCYPEGRNPHERKRTLHFDNTPRHNTRTVMGQLEQSGFKRMEHPPYSRNLAPYDLLFWLHERTVDRNELRSGGRASTVLSELMSDTPSDMILRVFVDWDRRLRCCLAMEGEQVE
jgi:hypothetical protein